MLGIFSRLSVIKGGHRRAQSALDNRDELGSKLEGGTVVGTASTAVLAGDGCTHHGIIEVEIGFKPAEHPSEPFADNNNDNPIYCPLPEPPAASILNRPGLSQNWEQKWVWVTPDSGELPFVNRWGELIRRWDMPILNEGTEFAVDLIGRDSPYLLGYQIGADGKVAISLSSGGALTVPEDSDREQQRNNTVTPAKPAVDLPLLLTRGAGVRPASQAVSLPTGEKSSDDAI
ncbi:unnamed protein product [Cuscuta epithymum]|uniref:Uncharacterized protein n=1 Tax=Cuscuta epithymum TaxID=186058 RepID=A0AAV0DGY0_9ASTE|nr:unnamed protein product [Cuscuta epithymum]